MPSSRRRATWVYPRLANFTVTHLSTSAAVYGIANYIQLLKVSRKSLFEATTSCLGKGRKEEETPVDVNLFRRYRHSCVGRRDEVLGAVELLRAEVDLGGRARLKLNDQGRIKIEEIK